jgi:hypothetical protein
LCCAVHHLFRHRSFPLAFTGAPQLSHLQLNTNGTCSLFQPGSFLGWGGGAGSAFGPDTAVLASCIASVTGTFECLAPNVSVSYTHLAAAGAASLTACLGACAVDAACEAALWAAGTATCTTAAAPLLGSSGANGLTAGLLVRGVWQCISRRQLQSFQSRESARASSRVARRMHPLLRCADPPPHPRCGRCVCARHHWRSSLATLRPW